MKETPTDIGIKELLKELSPSIAREAIKSSGAEKGLEGTTFSLVVEVSGEKYSYLVRDGKEFEITQGDLESPLVRVKIERKNLEKMIATKSLDMLLGIQSDLNKQKYNALKGMRGSFTAELTNDDGSVTTIEMILNNAMEPKTTFKMKTSDSISLVKRRPIRSTCSCPGP
ncbi:MAG TPA: sterol-binding protein [Spirochaetota bacterium]|nr:sterol-binding protein [Spirochaetota bacterium]HPC40664.1 sterol-binding protein [Spirochaetota bacterium]HPL18268.1 sterol-binding protein [Spirochaetota bacterium]HQF09428.1 sterol-binding protein [Spirochaetota bacterium]HQH97957.1 sterol-binding protein [Spirochaetota bacterium]